VEDWRWRVGGGLEVETGGGDWRRSEAETETVTVSGTVRRLEKLQ
jgi:hypothetical protein